MVKNELPSTTDGDQRLRRSQLQLAKSDFAQTKPSPTPEDSKEAVDLQVKDKTAAIEIEGPDGPDPTRYGDWERNGRCIDF